MDHRSPRHVTIRFDDLEKTIVVTIARKKRGMILISCTPNHRFFTEARKYARAGNWREVWKRLRGTVLDDAFAEVSDPTFEWTFVSVIDNDKMIR